MVTPHAGAWIEMFIGNGVYDGDLGHSPRGSVD